MPKSIVQLSLFVSSPGGLSQDRGAVQIAVDEANRILDAEGLMLRPFFWEKDAVPTKGDGYAQTAINAKISSETDILILLMHSRVGTATPAAMSGTIEEFEVAHATNESGKRRVEICIYFSVAPVSPLSDLDQLRAVQEFRSRVHNLGYLSRDYDDVGGFGVSLIPHLVEKARNFRRANYTNTDASEEPLVSHVPDKQEVRLEDEETLGFLDYEELVAAHLGSATEGFNEVRNLTEQIGDITGKYSEKLDNIHALSSRGMPIDRRVVVDEYAGELRSYNERLEPVVQGIDSALSLGAAAALSMMQEWPIDTEEARDAVRTFAETIGAAVSQMDEMIEPIATMAATLESWPGLTKRLKEARKKSVEVNRRLYAVIRRNLQVLSDAHAVALRRLDAD